MSQGLTFTERAIKHSAGTDMSQADIIKLSNGLNNHQAVTCLRNSFSAQRPFMDSFHTNNSQSEECFVTTRSKAKSEGRIISPKYPLKG